MNISGNKIRVAAVSAVLSGLIVSVPAFSSSHREAPNITAQPKVDATDFYMFRSYEAGREGYVTLIANYGPVQDGYAGPNYFTMDSRALYEIHIDNDGDAKEDLSFQFRFRNAIANNGKGIHLDINGEQVAVPLKNIGGISAEDQSALNFNENYRVTVVRGDRRSRDYRASLTDQASGSRLFTKPYDYVGDKTFANGAEYRRYADQFMYDVNIPGCDGAGRVFVGQRKDSFVVNLGETFDLVNYVPVEGDSAPGLGDGGGFPGGITQNSANDDLRRKNVTSIVLEIPTSCLTGTGNGVIGGWTTASLRQVSILNPKASFRLPKVVGGAWVQVSRLGNPLVNELVIGLKDKDGFNSSEPKKDEQFSLYVTNPTLPALINILFKDAVNATLGTSIADLAPSNFPRNDLIATFLTGIEGLNQLADVKAAEMIRLNTAIAPVPATQQSSFGVAGDDLAGFPNGRRPGDDVVDIALRVLMGRLCHPVPIAGNATDLGFCTPADAVVGTVPFTDGAPIDAEVFADAFPYLTIPVSGSPKL